MHDLNATERKLLRLLSSLALTDLESVGHVLAAVPNGSAALQALEARGLVEWRSMKLWDGDLDGISHDHSLAMLNALQTGAVRGEFRCLRITDTGWRQLTTNEGDGR